MAIIFRPMRDEDDAAIGVLHRRAILATDPAVYTQAQRESWASGIRPGLYLASAQKGEIFEIATNDDAVVGFCGRQHNGVIGLYVDPDFQGHGIGAALLAHAEAAIAAEGFDKVVIRGASTARGFYLARGYRITGSTEHRTHGGEMLAINAFEKKLPR